jgi:ABC-type Na+ efflux pump permease subunit
VRRNLKPWLLGWVLGIILGGVFMGIVTNSVNDENLYLLILAILALTAYAVLAFRRKRKPSKIAVLLGTVINPLPWFGLFVMAFSCGWGASDWYCSFL